VQATFLPAAARYAPSFRLITHRPTAPFCDMNLNESAHAESEGVGSGEIKITVRHVWTIIALMQRDRRDEFRGNARFIRWLVAREWFLVFAFYPAGGALWAKPPTQSRLSRPSHRNPARTPSPAWLHLISLFSTDSADVKRGYRAMMAVLHCWPRVLRVAQISRACFLLL
jgi:hypothetical protein